MALVRINGEVIEIDPAKLTNREGMAIEDVMGMTLAEAAALAERGSMKAITAFVWVHQRRGVPDLKFDDVEFAMGDVAEEPDPTSGPAEGAAPSRKTSKPTGRQR